MDVGGHQNISVQKEIEMLLVFTQKLKVETVILGLSESSLPLISPSNHMI
jgi:hypothetical protein